MAGRCIECGGNTSVIDTTEVTDGHILVSRRRECKECNVRFTTCEIERDELRNIFVELGDLADNLGVRFNKRRDSVLNVYLELSQLLLTETTGRERIDALRKSLHGSPAASRTTKRMRKLAKGEQFAERDKHVLNLRNEVGLTLREIGEKHGLTRERIRQIVDEQQDKSKPEKR